MINELVGKLQILEISPKNLPLYQTAFTHRSYLNETKQAVESNERLEFLGDAVLSLIMSSYLYQIRPNDQEGDLTNLRSYIIKTESLAKAAQNLDLGKFLRLSKGEELSGGRYNLQLLANTYEALLGAIYVDLGIEQARKFVDSTLITLFDRALKFGPPKDAKSQLQELIQNKTKASPKYKILSTLGPDHAKVFRVGVFLDSKIIGEGVGSNKQAAEEEAAKKALIRLTKSSH